MKHITCNTKWRKFREIADGVYQWRFRCEHKYVKPDHITDELQKWTDVVEQWFIGDGSHLPPVDQQAGNTYITHPGEASDEPPILRREYFKYPSNVMWPGGLAA